MAKAQQSLAAWVRITGSRITGSRMAAGSRCSAPGCVQQKVLHNRALLSKTFYLAVLLLFLFPSYSHRLGRLCNSLWAVKLSLRGLQKTCSLLLALTGIEVKFQLWCSSGFTSPSHHLPACLLSSTCSTGLQAVLGGFVNKVTGRRGSSLTPAWHWGCSCL